MSDPNYHCPICGTLSQLIIQFAALPFVFHFAEMVDQELPGAPAAAQRAWVVSQTLIAMNALLAGGFVPAGILPNLETVIGGLADTVARIRRDTGLDRTR